MLDPVRTCPDASCDLAGEHMRYYHYQHGWLDGVVLAHDASRGGPLAYPVRLAAPPGGQETERVILLGTITAWA